MNNLYKLPETWVWIAAESVCKIVSGFAFKSSDFCDNGIPAIKIANVSYGEFLWKQQEYLPTDFLEKYSEFQVRPGTLIMALTRPITNDTVKACLYPLDAPIGLLNQRVALLEPCEGYSKLFLLNVIHSNFFKELIKSGLSETLQPNLSPQSLKQFSVPLPPLNEQRRIVGKIEALKARSQRVKEELEAIPVLLDQFRQSVLAAAFCGDLTADWRKQNSGYTNEIHTATVIDYYSHKITAPRNWKKYAFKEVCKLIGGSQPPKEHFINELQNGYIRLIQIRDYKSDKFATYTPIKLARRFCSKDDIMIGRYGPPIFQILRGLEGAYNVALMKAEPDLGKIEKEFLYYYLQSPELFNYVAAGSLRTAGQDGVRKEHLDEYPVFLPPVEEQQEIVRRIETFLKTADQVKQQYQEAQAYLDQLNQSILAKAFRGELVPQDPNDEPASVLLERIRAEREKLDTKKKAKGKTEKKSRKAKPEPAEPKQLSLPGFE